MPKFEGNKGKGPRRKEPLPSRLKEALKPHEEYARKQKVQKSRDNIALLEKYKSKLYKYDKPYTPGLTTLQKLRRRNAYFSMGFKERVVNPERAKMARIDTAEMYSSIRKGLKKFKTPYEKWYYLQAVWANENGKSRQLFDDPDAREALMELEQKLALKQPADMTEDDQILRDYIRLGLLDYRADDDPDPGLDSDEEDMVPLEVMSDGMLTNASVVFNHTSGSPAT